MGGHRCRRGAVPHARRPMLKLLIAGAWTKTRQTSAPGTMRGKTVLGPNKKASARKIGSRRSVARRAAHRQVGRMVVRNTDGTNLAEARILRLCRESPPVVHLWSC